VIPNAVDIDRFEPGAAQTRPSSGARSDRLHGHRLHRFLLCLRRLDLLLTALPAILQRAARRARACSWAGGLQESALKADAAARDSRQGGVRGRVPHQQVQRYYDLIDVLRIRVIRCD
jgi:hypothetical protein